MNTSHAEQQSLHIRASCKTAIACRFFSLRKAKTEGAGGHIWHDAVIEANIITPAKCILPDVN